MKKLLSVSLAAMLTLAPFAAHGADDITVTLDGKAIEFDVPPQIIDDFTFVPMRAIFEALGATVLWDDTTKTVTSEKGADVIMMTLGYNTMFVNFAPVTLEAAPRIVGERTLVPVRAVAESFDCAVGWDADTKTVTITQPTDETKTEPKTENTFPVTYDDSNEYKSSLAKNFVITSVTLTEDGNYEIDYTVNTYRESSGDVIVQYNCYDSEGKLIGNFSQKFFAYAYSWTPQASTAVIPRNTAVIKLADNE